MEPAEKIGTPSYDPISTFGDGSLRTRPETQTQFVELGSIVSGGIRTTPVIVCWLELETEEEDALVTELTEILSELLEDSVDEVVDAGLPNETEGITPFGGYSETAAA